MINKKVICGHCKTHIANFHDESNWGEFKAPATVVPTKKGILKKIRYAGTTSTDRYSSEIGLRVQFQIGCTECGKNTTDINFKHYSVS